MLPLKNNSIISATSEEILRYAPDFAKSHIEKGVEWVQNLQRKALNKTYGGAGQACVIANLVHAGIIPKLFADTAPFDFMHGDTCFEVKTRLFNPADGILAPTYTMSEAERDKARQVSKLGGKYFLVLLEQLSKELNQFKYNGCLDFENIKFKLKPSKHQDPYTEPSFWFWAEEVVYERDTSWT